MLHGAAPNAAGGPTSPVDVLLTLRMADSYLEVTPPDLDGARPMKRAHSQRFCTLVIALLLLALPAGAINVHEHVDGQGKTCTLCKAPRLADSFSAAPELTSPFFCADRVVPRRPRLAVDVSGMTVRSRAPPPHEPAS